MRQLALQSHAHLLDAGALVGNWADYSRGFDQPNSVVYCGWMDLHDDKASGVSETGRLWGFRPLFWCEDAVFVHTLPKHLGGGLRAVDPCDGVVFFRADLRHGLIPRQHVDSVLKRRSSKHIRMDWSEKVPPKLVWRWVCPRSGREYTRYPRAPMGLIEVDGWRLVTEPCCLDFPRSPDEFDFSAARAA